MNNIKEVRVFVRAELQKERVTNAYLNTLLKRFKEYKAGAQDPHFGKDVPYHKPAPYAEWAKLKHVHVLKKVQGISVRRSDTSDSVLIYTEASMHPNMYYVIDFIADKAHEKAQDPDYMGWLIDKAEAFRMRK